MSQDRTVTDEELSAFADGQLSRQASARVAAHLRANPGDADRIHAYWKHEAELYRVFAAGPGRAAAPAVKSGRGPLYAAAAAAILLAFATPWLLLDGSGQAPALSSQPPAQQAVATYAGLELQPGGDELAVEGQFTQYHFSDAGGTVLVLYESAAAESGYPPLEADTARVEWVAQGNHYVLEGALGAAELMSLAVSLRRQVAAPSPVPAGDMLAAPPAAGQALQPLPEAVLPAGVSKM